MGRLDPRQIAIWARDEPGPPPGACQFAPDAAPRGLIEQQRHPDLSPDELAWWVTRRMQGNPRLGR